MTADQARQLNAKPPQTDKDIKQYHDIAAKIRIAASGGDSYIWYYENLTHNVKLTLEKDGFQVKDQSHRSEKLIQISWEVLI